MLNIPNHAGVRVRNYLGKEEKGTGPFEGMGWTVDPIFGHYSHLKLTTLEALMEDSIMSSSDGCLLYTEPSQLGEGDLLHAANAGDRSR